ncbi:MAG TPA: hypothetical protein VFE32_17335 [Puia sp.]|jgi:hypothetical protein|nr:hypothetical protein [Puia sp.]
MNTLPTFSAWCLVELFGHARIAGFCTEQNIAGANMLRVDVPETKDAPSFTRFFGSTAIYALNPVDEETARHIAGQLHVKPVQIWDIQELVKKHMPALPTSDGVGKALAGEAGNEEEEDHEL